MLASPVAGEYALALSHIVVLQPAMRILAREREAVASTVSSHWPHGQVTMKEAV